MISFVVSVIAVLSHSNLERKVGVEDQGMSVRVVDGIGQMFKRQTTRSSFDYANRSRVFATRNVK